MPYRVTSGMFQGSKPMPAKIEPGFDLKEKALDRARQLLQRGEQHVMISDDRGNSISGPDLAACCDGTKTLTADLRAN
jgi:hypothetical protein